MDSSATATWTRSIALAGLCAIAVPHAAGGYVQPPQTQLSSPAADAELIAALQKKGVRLETDRITAWFSPKAMSREDAMQPGLVVRRVFYGCAASFTKYLVGRLGLERFVDVLPEDDPHETLEAFAGATMASLRSSWMETIAAKTPR